jgi:rare lipoprotein A
MKLFLIISFLFTGNLFAGDTMEAQGAKPRLLYGTASYYSNSFNGKQTANGEIYSHKKMTAACNVLPLGTWIKVTNLRNGKSVVVKTNDRLHTRMKRVVDLSREAADKLDYVKSGLTRVRVEVIGKKKPEK